MVAPTTTASGRILTSICTCRRGHLVAVTSVGNTLFIDLNRRGFGSIDRVNLEFNFEPDVPLTASLNDVAGVPLDGAADGTSGGVYSFAFQADDHSVYGSSSTDMGG